MAWWLRIHLQCRRHWRLGFNPWVRKILWRRKWQPTAVFLPEKISHGQRSLVCCSSWGLKSQTCMSDWIPQQNIIYGSSRKEKQQVSKWYHLIPSNFCVCLVTQLCQTLCDPIDWSPPDSSVHGDSPGKNTGVGCHVLQGILPTQGNSGLPHCRWILYSLSY